MKFLILLLIVVGAVGAWLYFSGEVTYERRDQIREELNQGADRVKEAFRQGMDKFSLNTDQIKEELSKSGNVIRRKAGEIGTAISDATADARITGRIKAKLVADSELSALKISVDTTNGVVTLAGTVSSHDEIGKAMVLALETEGVREVISTLQVRMEKTSETNNPQQ